jgi:hypothetical protein
VFKNFRVTERTGVQFRAEFFNMFNQVNFDNPVTNSGGTFATLTGGGFGTLTRTNPAGGDPRIIQFGLKLSF